ncbi:MAG TPA: CHASE2 domain-containing protein [Thioploca sp.]|nr:CHASE2 domain-containing protein [Thioploca sp.]
MFKILEKNWNKNWFIVLCISMILLFISYLNMLQPLEYLVYDLGIKKYKTNEDIAIIMVEENSLNQTKTWSDLVQVINLVAANSRAIGINIPFSKLPQNIERFYIEQLIDFYQQSFNLSKIEQLSNLLQQLKQIKTRYTKDKRLINQFYDIFQNSLLTLPEFEQKLRAANTALNIEQQLLNSFKQTNKIMLGMPVTLNESNNGLISNLPTYLQKHSLTNIRESFDNNDTNLKMGITAKLPLAKFSNNVTGIGYTSNSDSHDIPLVIKYKDSYIPSLALLLAAQNLDNIEVQLGKGIRLGKLRINTDHRLQIRPFSYPKLPIYSITEILNGKISAIKYKIILLGTMSDSETYPDKSSTLIVANTLVSLLNQNFIKIPDWAMWLQSSIFIILLVYLGFLWNYLKWRTSIIVSICLMITLSVLYFILLSNGLLVQLMLLIILVLIGHIVLQLKRWVVNYQDVFRLLPDAVESNRLLGLAFQGQGHLDLAFEKFCLCPANESIVCLLYNLALDYERKRKFRQASVVYRYIDTKKPDFRDITQRLVNLKKLSRKSLNNWRLEESGSILGRYQIEKPLGKGAMGTVYLGRDAKLNRLVAIKTLSLSQEFGTEQLPEATVRFFQEASAAGRLKHPNIVSIYDAGEEQNLAYISMEFFKGGTLLPYTQTGNLLPIATVIDIVILMAEALDYAHSHGVIHRDIKPANIMYNPATNKIKITDFGIARITDTNRTRTGIILGTPSYMSPEQLAAKQLDGRSDLFSLGVMFYQLLSGSLPFESESLTTLMFKIANEPHTDISEICPKLPDCIKQIVNTALNKEIKYRYQSGTQFAIALRDCHKFEEGIK